MTQRLRSRTQFVTIADDGELIKIPLGAVVETTPRPEGGFWLVYEGRRATYLHKNPADYGPFWDVVSDNTSEG